RMARGTGWSPAVSLGRARGVEPGRSGPCRRVCPRTRRGAPPGATPPRKKCERALVRGQAHLLVDRAVGVDRVVDQLPRALGIAETLDQGHEVRLVEGLVALLAVGLLKRPAEPCDTVLGRIAVHVEAAEAIQGFEVHSRVRQAGHV